MHERSTSDLVTVEGIAKHKENELVKGLGQGIRYRYRTVLARVIEDRRGGRFDVVGEIEVSRTVPASESRFRVERSGGKVQL